MDLDWCIKVYDTVDILSTSEDAPQNARVIWSEIDDRVAYVSKTLIPIRFVGAAPAESDSDGVPSNYSPRCNRVAAALRSFPTPPAPPPTPIPLQRPKSSPLDRKVRMRSFAKDPAHTENINEPTFLEEVATSIVKIVSCTSKITVTNVDSFWYFFCRNATPQLPKKRSMSS